MITLKQINYAIAVAETLHFKKAAEKCFVSPSTLSNAITEMESQLGLKIFERDNKKVIVTNLGKSIIEKAKNIKNEIEKLSIKPDKELNHGEIALKVNGITIRKTIR